jgi:hypothetical protein
VALRPVGGALLDEGPQAGPRDGPSGQTTRAEIPIYSMWARSRGAQIAGVDVSKR